MSKKVLLLTQWFDPEPTFKGLLFARELAQRGYDVEVVTGFPNYPGGKIYDGYQICLWKKEVIDGVKIIRLPLYPSHDQSSLKRIFNYLSFAFSSLIYTLFFASKPDVVYAYHPPLTIGLVAVFVRFFRRIPVVYDVQDMWPDTLSATGMLLNRRALAVIDGVAKFVYRHVDKLVVLSPGFKQLLFERGVSGSKISVIPNWCDEAALVIKGDEDISPLFAGSRMKIAFAGNMGKAQALDLVVDAARELLDVEVDFVLVGGGVDLSRLKKTVEDESLENILFHDQVPMSKVGALLSQADVLLVHLKRNPLFAVTIPSKTQAYLFVGKPILMGVEGDAANIVKDAHAGVCFEPENVSSFVSAVRNLVNMPKNERNALGENGKHYYFKKLSVESGVNSFSRVFEEVMQVRIKC